MLYADKEEAKMGKTYKIGVIPGDGTGPEVVAEGIKVLNAVSGKLGFSLNYTYYDIGGPCPKASSAS